MKDERRNIQIYCKIILKIPFFTLLEHFHKNIKVEFFQKQTN